MNVKEIIQQASSGDGVFSGSCDSRQNKGKVLHYCGLEVQSN